MPLRTVATRELVVPRSMPTARAEASWEAPVAVRRSAAAPSRLRVDDRRLDVGRQLRQELQLPHRAARRGQWLRGVELRLQCAFERSHFCAHLCEQLLERARV